MTNIAVIGVGGLGARHLQSLANLTAPARIQAMDVSDESLTKAKGIFESMKPGAHLTVSYCKSIQELENNLDVVIIATSSNVRRKVTEELLDSKKVRYLVLEKVLFPQVEDYEAVRELLDKTGCKAWVNCPRRMSDFYASLRELFASEPFLEVSATGSHWGLGCNSIHLIDIIGYLAGSEGLALDTSRIDNGIIESKRKGFIELTGTITGSIGRCTHFSLTSVAGNPGAITLTISSPGRTCIVSEGTGVAMLAKMENGWALEELSCRGRYQSEMTSGLVEQLLNSGNCPLPSYDTATAEHIPFIQAILEFVSEKRGERVTICPIT